MGSGSMGSEYSTGQFLADDSSYRYAQQQRRGQADRIRNQVNQRRVNDLQHDKKIDSIGLEASPDLEKELFQMPWTPDDAERHTHKATSWALKELWAKVANEALERTSDEGRSIREANSVIARHANA